MSTQPQPQAVHCIFSHGDRVSLLVDGYFASEDDVAAFYAHEIARQPKNLKIHVQHVMFCIKHQLATQLASALLDLYIVLHANGLPLRQRLFKQSQSLLDDEVGHFLQQSLLSGIHARTVIPFPHRSVLSKAYIGVEQWLIKTPNQDAVFNAPLDEALSLLEHGDVAEARSVLETSLRQSPNDELISQELINIYQHQHDIAALKTQIQWYADSDITMPALWQEALHNSQAQVSTDRGISS